MGYAVYEANDRWQGYGVPAFCDYPGCKKKIDRGMGYQHEEDKKNSPPNVFCCSDHQYEKLDSFEVESKESPEWVTHLLDDPSWSEWRAENPDTVQGFLKLVEKEG
jgi:hypothetical protein